MADKLLAVKGMNDILPPDSRRWEWFEGVVRDLMARYGYLNIRTPIVEPTALFVRGLGEVTDIVEKEMYSFRDALNGEALTLRPESTAGVVRAVVEHTMLHDGGKRMYYMGPMFRHERPQRGRYRQFHQVGAEAIGFAGPDVDAELILMCAALWRDLGLNDVRLELNSLGQPDERRRHRADLIAYLEKHEQALDADARRRLHSNPLRILDSKHPGMQEIVEGAPKLIDYLGTASLKHFESVQAVLQANDVAYRINPRLVRGMDYYNLTVFEWVTDRLGSQGTVCGGGRYDDLIAQIGGKAAPAVGWALGVERVLELLKEVGALVPEVGLDAYAIVPDEAAVTPALRLAEQLRQAGLRILVHAGGGSMKAQFRRADASGARFALIFGQTELAQGAVGVKSLRDASLTQTVQPLAEAASWAGMLRSA